MADTVALELHLMNVLKFYKASQTLNKSWDRVTDFKPEEVQDTTKTTSSHINPIDLNGHSTSIGQDLVDHDLNKLKSCERTSSLIYFGLIKTVFLEILRLFLGPVWLFLAAIAHAKIRGNNSDVVSSLGQETGIRHSSEQSQLETFLHDLEDSPFHLQQTFLNQLISRCVLRLEDYDNSDLAVFNLQVALGKDVHQNIRLWLARLQGAVYRVVQMPVHPLLSSYNRRDLAQRTVQLLQRKLDIVKSPNDTRYQQTPIPLPLPQITSEQEQQLWDLGVGIDPSVNKRAIDAISIPQHKVDCIIEEARKPRSTLLNLDPVDTSQVCRFVFPRVSGLTPEGLNALSIFIGVTLKTFPILASTKDFAIAESLYLLWIATENPCQYLETGQFDLARSLLKILPDRLQHAQPRELTVVFLLGLRTSVHILGHASDQLPARNPYVAFCNLMASSPTSDKEATLDSMCLGMIAELRQLELVDLEQFATYHMGGTQRVMAIPLLRCYSQYRLANPPVSHEETVHDLATRMAADSRQARQGLPGTDDAVGETSET